MKKELKIPTLVGLLVAIGGLAAGLWLLSGPVRQRLFAAAGEEPKEVKITNIADTSFVVSWLTDTAVGGFVQYGESGQQPDLVVSDERDQQKGTIDGYMTHYVVVRGLKPQTTYSFRVGSGKNLYDKNGQVYSTSTGPALTNPPAADVAYGQVTTTGGEAADGTLVYLSIAGMAEQASLVKPSGSWVIPLSTARSTDLLSFANYSQPGLTMNLTLRDGSGDPTRVTVPVAQHTPVAQITLGQSTGVSLSPVVPTNPSSSTESASSKISADLLSLPTEAGQLVILAPKFGEKVNSARPVIIGNAPSGAEITVEIHSENVVTGKVVANSEGAFTFSVPDDLAPGQHTVTISAVIDGVVKKVTRSFTVYAAGESSVPFYSATPSATLAPSPTVITSITPTIKISPSVTPFIKVSITPTPTSIPRTVNPSTSSALPVSGYDTPTFIMVGMGLALMLGGGWWYRRAS